MKKKPPTKARAPKRKAAPAPAEPAAPPSNAPPAAIVGIGASAGGLEALQVFLERMVERSGLAFVVIHHRDPSQRGMLVEILQRATSMPVAEPTEGETVVANHVYVIPPDRDLVILHGRVHLLPAHIAHG